MGLVYVLASNDFTSYTPDSHSLSSGGIDREAGVYSLPEEMGQRFFCILTDRRCIKVPPPRTCSPLDAPQYYIWGEGLVVSLSRQVRTDYARHSILCLSSLEEIPKYHAGKYSQETMSVKNSERTSFHLFINLFIYFSPRLI